MRCIGLKKNLHRCKNQQNGRIFCHEHSRQWIAWTSFILFTVFSGIASIYSVFPLLEIRNIVSKPTYSDFSKMDFEDAINSCNSFNFREDILYERICGYLLYNSDDFLNKRTSVQQEYIDVNFPDGYPNFPEFVKIISPLYKDNLFEIKGQTQYGEKCESDEMIFSAITLSELSAYYSIYLQLLDKNISGDYKNNIEGIYPTYIETVRFSAQSIGVKLLRPYDYYKIIKNNEILKNTYKAMIDAERSNIYARTLDIIIEYKQFYQHTKERLIKEGKLNDFLTKFNNRSVFNDPLDYYNEFEIESLYECFGAIDLHYNYLDKEYTYTF